MFLLKPESDEGSVEYKRHLVNPSARNFEKLTTQLLWRLNEGGGECLYEIGVDDDGFVRGISEEEMKFSVETLEKWLKQLSKVSEAFERKTSEKGALRKVRVGEKNLSERGESFRVTDNDGWKRRFREINSPRRVDEGRVG